MPVFAPGASLAAASFCRHHRDTEPGEIQIAIKCEVARCDRVLFAFVNRRYSFSDSSRDFALDSTWNWQRRAASAVVEPLPAAAGATAAAGKGLLARLAGCGGISRKLPADFCRAPRFLSGIRERLRSWCAPARSETLKRFSSVVSPGQVFRRDGPRGTRSSPSSWWCSRKVC